VERIMVWETIEKKLVLTGKIFRYFSIKRKSPLTLKIGDFDVIQFSNWVNVVALTPENEFVFVKQYRHGTNKFTLEIAGGALELDEEGLIGAQRELQEETGYTSSEWIKLGQTDVVAQKYLWAISGTGRWPTL
jgi:ADP-ribose pyrophosphatase